MDTENILNKNKLGPGIFRFLPENYDASGLRGWVLAIFIISIIIFIILIIIYIVFFVGTNKILNDKHLMDNKNLKAYTITAIVLISLMILFGIIGYVKPITWLWIGILMPILFIVAYIMTILIYINVKDTAYAKYILPLLIWYSILVALYVIFEIVIAIIIAKNI